MVMIYDLRVQEEANKLVSTLSPLYFCNIK
jgi:hypothetical protein